MENALSAVAGLEDYDVACSMLWVMRAVHPAHVPSSASCVQKIVSMQNLSQEFFGGGDAIGLAMRLEHGSCKSLPGW